MTMREAVDKLATGMRDQEVRSTFHCMGCTRFYAVFYRNNGPAPESPAPVAAQSFTSA